MDQNEQFTTRARKLLERITTEVKGANNLLDQIITDDILSQPIIGGDEDMKKQPSELEQLRAEREKLIARRPVLWAKLQSRELALRVSRLNGPDGGLMTITTVMKEGRRAYTDPEGKKWPEIPPTLATTKVPKVEPPRVCAHLAGTDQRGPEYHAAVLARKEYSDNEFRISDLDRRIAIEERKVNEYLKVQANAEAERNRAA